jgi:hypothetical protein
MRKPAYNASDVKEALAKAERQHTTAGRPVRADASVDLLPSEVQMRPELFQPREFSFGLRATDRDHVKKLARAIGIQGELDPIVVIKLGKKFVCVDGHHRLEAYREKKWVKPIKCEWFGGNVREVDESVTRNAKDRLNVPQADRLEAAWKRVLLEWGSKAEIVRLCGVGDGTVAQMRRVKERASEQGQLGIDFRRSLGFRLNETSWSQAKLAYLGVEKNEIDDELRAERLARRIRARLTNLLSRDPKVTARALALYDPELPKGIADAWGVPSAGSAMADGEDGNGVNAAAALSGSDKALQREAETHRQRISAIEAELARRACGGTPSDHAWDEWTRTDQA